ncbi:uncharacterized protein LOC133814806 [Humulus lupulus]|uniref:uncharacterized protein LOC133814806 n=1 Tax=Humulus lupulus TaxID=3486 RepID=UPI002B415060|nr:uncharacterized protein LOC133814806 [Humulus lupulus]
MWSVLTQILSNKSKARVLQLRGLLQTTKKGATHVDEYVLKMQCLADALMVVGQAISDDDLIMYILGGLGSEYESVVVNLTSKDSVTLQEVQFMLQSQELRLEQQHALFALDLHPPTVNYASVTKNESSTSSSGYSAHNRGSQCGRGDRFYPNRNTGNRPICQLCNKLGHVVLKCYKRFDLSFHGDTRS